jgi:peroxiredoxin
MKRRIIVALTLALAAIAAAANLTLLRPAPEVRFTALSGQSLSTSDLRGKVVLVNFWATYCASCVQEMPKVVETYKKFEPRGFDIVAIAARRDSPERVADFARTHALPFKVVLDGSGEVAKHFGNVRATPTIFLIDKQGRTLRRYVGEPDWKELHALVERALGS